MPRSPIHAVHEDLGARFVDFGGWEMPLQYEGVIAEHRAVRTGAGVFDVSHLGRLELRGPGSSAVLRHLLCNDATAVEPGRAQYTMALNQHGGVVDDIIVWRRGEEDYLVLPNGANHRTVLGRFRAEAPEGVEIEDRREDTALFAVQGPAATDIIAEVAGAAPARFRLSAGSFGGEALAIAGTGYTGERGGEIAVPLAVAGDLFRAFVAAGAVPCGLGARDTLRLEMGYPLWGQDLDEATTPLEAGLGWVVDWDHDFVGKEALARQRDGGLSKRLVGFVLDGRRIPRHGYPLRAGDSAGAVASGNFSPTLECGIGMGYLAPDPGPDPHGLEVDIRGDWLPARATEPPFIRSD